MSAPRQPAAPVRRGLVLDVETRIDRAALRASGRSGSPRDMPPGLQMVVAGAILAFEIDAAGDFGAFTLHSAHCATSGERTLIRLLDRELARLHRQGGVLVSFNGGHDLAVIRLAALRHAEFATCGAANWQSGGTAIHEDLMLELAGRAHGRWASLADLSAALGFQAPGEVALGPTAVPRELAKCETDVLATMALYMHVLAERAGSDAPLRNGVAGLANLLDERSDRSPHLRSVLNGRLFQNFAAG